MGRDTSATWQLTVPNRTAAVSAVGPGPIDVNGDGLADVAIAAEQEPATPLTDVVGIHLGTRTGPTRSPSVTLRGRDGRFGEVAVAAGDVNGDGYGDLAVGAPGAANDVGRVYVYHGGSAGLATTAATTLEGRGRRTFFGASVAGVGDLDGDGFGDIVVGAWCDPHVSEHMIQGSVVQECGRGKLYVFRGSARGVSRIASATIDGPVTEQVQFGGCIRPAWDVDADGFADLVVATVPALYVYRGRPSGLSASPRVSIVAPPELELTGFAEGAGDLDGDGYPDLVANGKQDVGYSYPGRLLLFGGGPSGVTATPMAVLTAAVGLASEYAKSVSAAGDVDQDGYWDVAAGDETREGSRGIVLVHSGASSSIGASPPSIVRAPQGAMFFGTAVRGVGDADGDGASDLVVESRHGAQGGRRIDVVFGARRRTRDARSMQLVVPGAPG